MAVGWQAAPEQGAVRAARQADSQEWSPAVLVREAVSAQEAALARGGASAPEDLGESVAARAVLGPAESLDRVVDLRTRARPARGLEDNCEALGARPWRR